MTSFDPRKARELLDFYLDSGVETLVGETPVMRFAAATMALPAGKDPPRAMAAPGSSVDLARAAPGARQANALPAPEEAVMAAREAAKSAATLDELRAILDRFEGCGLKATATQLVFADGNPSARLMLVGEAPGRDEDIEGRPFVGRSGKLLDRMLAAIGLDRSSVYIANVVPWRPPGNREPSPHETAICLPFIRRQIELCDPEILVCLGKPSMQTLLEINDPISKARGRWFSYHTGKREIRAMATFHPAFLLRSPLQKRLAWRDFLAIKKALDG
ncbi:MAG: uracil-DNA glycosylase [Pseudolabrys sp.]|nr:uracil-DNA glycosylase [Pseudolabrys sp.]